MTSPSDEQMNLYRISQTVNNDWDTYDSAVVAAMSMTRARLIHPGKKDWDGTTDRYDTWCAARDVTVELIGVAKKGTEEGVICASFNAG